MTLAQTLDGQLWMSGSRVSRVTISGGRLKFEPADVPPPQGGGMDLKVDKNDSVWTCYSGGLAHQDGSAWHVLSMTSGLRQNDCAAFAIDQKEAIWYGYTSGGFAMIESLAANRPNIQTFQGGGEVGNATTRFFESDHRGWLWRGTPIGIYVAAIEEARQGRWLFLNRSDGLPGTDANQRSFVEGKDGSVWFGMDNSVIHFFPPDDLVHPRHSPSVFVSG
jgi:ligand-binding sensor domain-containing protein